ncbi:arylsulfatase B [Caerostris extrusa]|uniref:Arylsulfatase B n=1 Tax=Caerostris extrusa TaxID=172846 RepID=A0AAV4MNH4_CAEEX|nr:arylsulfatase B [Caerostris extrusa]
MYYNFRNKKPKTTWDKNPSTGNLDVRDGSYKFVGRKVFPLGTMRNITVSLITYKDEFSPSTFHTHGEIKLFERKETSQPHIIFIFADDLGWNDISLHGSPQIPTPNIDALALNGLILHNYYTWRLCTPSRGTFLTGKYPNRLGLQHSPIKVGESSGLPLYEVTLPQHLKKLGYRTHMIGKKMAFKWHLGYQTKEYTPTYRGFDTFFGFLNGFIDYYDHTVWEPTFLPNIPHYYGLDFHNGTTILKDKQGQYATHLFTEEAENIILNHDTSKPLFLYLSHLASHTGNDFKPVQAPQK